MKIKCEYCGSFIDDTDEKCANCGGVNGHLVRSAVGVPQTIEELKRWCQDKNIPLKDARFFIGEDYRGARAFGIYRDEKTENYIVYKNKSDGTRAVRYEGKDESYAVNEIYQKLKEEILNQKQHLAQKSKKSGGSSNTNYNSRSYGNSFFKPYLYFGIVVLFAIFLLWCLGLNNPSRGYYDYNNQVYYYQPGDSWYVYDHGDWSSTVVDSELYDHSSDYYNSESYSSQYDSNDFSDSGYYNENSDDSYDSDWDSGDSWDSSDSWDSGYSDWDSDWCW